MTLQAPAPPKIRLPLLQAAAVAAALAIFVADALTPPDCVVSGLYVVVVLMAGRFCRPRTLWLVSAGCVALTVAAQFLAHRFGNDQAAYIGAFNTSVSIVAVGLSTYLVVRGQAAEAALNRAQSDLAHVSRVTTMGELTASIAHEVNQPIAAAVANASACIRWLAGEAPNLEEARAAAARIVRDGTRAAEIISRIRLFFTKGGQPRQAVDLNQLARETAELLSGEAGRYGVVLRTDLAADMAPVSADRVQLQQVLVNLIVNGVDAMKTVAGARELVLASRRPAPDLVEVSVSDTGVGLGGAEDGQIFEAFYTTKPHGTGMGLSISRSIIEAHQGRLSAAPNRPRGATFTFTLPVGAEG